VLVGTEERGENPYYWGSFKTEYKQKQMSQTVFQMNNITTQKGGEGELTQGTFETLNGLCAPRLKPKRTPILTSN
jgi:hypothetical protein